MTVEAGLVGADLGFGAGGAVETGGEEPGVDMHRGTRGIYLHGELEGALETVVAHRTDEIYGKCEICTCDYSYALLAFDDFKP